MLLTFKTLQQESFSIDIEPACKIAQVKEAILAAKGFSVSSQKLIHSGKILNDAASIEELKISEKDFIVVMVSKPKAAPSASVATPAPAPAPVAAPVVAAPGVAPVPAAAPVVAPVVAPTTAAAPTASDDIPTTTSTLATGAVYESAVASLVEMGFSHSQVTHAMRAAFNNPNRAAEYLTMGIPDHISRELGAATTPSSATHPTPTTTPAAVAAAAATTTPTATTTASAAPPPSQHINLFEAAAAQARSGSAAAHTLLSRAAGTTGAADPATLAFLRSSPQFQQLRQLVQTQPQLLQPLLQQIGQSNPELLQLLSQNQDQFLQMLNESGDEEMSGDDSAAGGEMAESGQQISVTPEENEAILRLAGLGFDRGLALEAYFACDKNEELAANYLFDNGQGDDWQ
ncbi:hypothetical protein BASA62_005717 [Batrachochytrium salamandrivorans]|nr:hypothetical protein BASA62_005717 [Batrachochytrium salamandrivorans]